VVVVVVVVSVPFTLLPGIVPMILGGGKGEGCYVYHEKATLGISDSSGGSRERGQELWEEEEEEEEEGEQQQQQ